MEQLDPPLLPADRDRAPSTPCFPSVRPAHEHLRRTGLAVPVAGLRTPGLRQVKIGRASCWERVFQYVLISVVAVSLTKNNKQNYHSTKIHTENLNADKKNT